jgi:hypothetical protein
MLSDQEHECLGLVLGYAGGLVDAITGRFLDALMPLL